ncbi:MAG TPA: pyridoxamine 5'-phosphate oxidase family protein [Nocardioidaceae bacterium]|jgi:nitroimidazol reductase NimA-like FMN-containing flavoprotein (pyridoxamine 5'-phosphate oxidase superfamily)|nr:pyridoxamine 5'-phosphate oxidase family protein [Nocardioidaceae bacterium]
MHNDPVELTIEECLELLTGGVLGRVAICTPLGPRIIPLNYAVHDDSVIFRTTPYSVVGTYGWNTELAFEVDHIDYEKHQGWSVVAIGRGEMIDDPDQLRAIQSGWDPTPWAGGRRHLYIRLRWRDLSGRRIGGDWTRDSAMPVRRVL